MFFFRYAYELSNKVGTNPVVKNEQQFLEAAQRYLPAPMVVAESNNKRSGPSYCCNVDFMK